MRPTPPHHHERPYQPYTLHRERFPRAALACVMVLVVSLLGAWGLSKAEKAKPGYRMRPAETTTLSHAATALSLQPSESGLIPSPAGEPLQPSASEQELSRALAELDSEMSRTARLAKKMGQEEAHTSLELKYEALEEAVKDRAIPWNESDRVDLELQTRTLRAQVSKFSNELEELAVRL